MNIPKNLTPRVPQLRCEIRATKRLASVLVGIVQTCAGDLGQPVVIDTTVAGSARIPVITLVLSVGLMLEAHHTWCLACRIACFCSEARVSVLVTGEPEAIAA